MSLHEYLVSQEISKKDYPFYSLLFALIRQADQKNTDKIREMWPEKFQEMADRYNAPGGILPKEAENMDPTKPLPRFNLDGTIKEEG